MAQFVTIFEGPTLAKAKPILTSTDARVVEAVLKSIAATIKEPQAPTPGPRSGTPEPA